MMADDPEQLAAFLRGETDDPGVVRAVRGGVRWPSVAGWPGVRVSVLVPFRGDGGGPRDRAWEFVWAWWKREHPDFAVHTGTGPGADQPWCKAVAVADALQRTCDSDVLIVADADVVCSGISTAVAVVASGSAPWAVPHRRVNRLTQAATERVLTGGGLPATPRLQRHHPGTVPVGYSPDVAESYKGVLGGGLVVLPRALYEQVPLDPRFLGWGQEDASWGRALNVMAPGHYRGDAPLHHLHHPPTPRINRAIGNRDGLALHHRYLNATTAADMGNLLAEIRSPVG